MLITLFYYTTLKIKYLLTTLFFFVTITKMKYLTTLAILFYFQPVKAGANASNISSNILVKMLDEFWMKIRMLH